jgi:hypothetical protein
MQQLLRVVVLLLPSTPGTASRLVLHLLAPQQ